MAVTQALDVVQSDLDSISECCSRITGALATTRHASADLLDETAKLRRSLEASLHRSRLVEQFLEQYQLSHDEVYALQVRASLQNSWGGPRQSRLLTGTGPVRQALLYFALPIDCQAADSYTLLRPIADRK